MNSTLETLKDDLKEKAIKDFAYNIVKYQKFITKVAVGKFEHAYSKTTACNYFDAGLKYLRTGNTFNANYNKKLYTYIDEAVANHVQPLIPKKDEERQIKKGYYARKENNPPITKLAVVKKPLTAKISYGVQINDNIVVCKTEDEARAFLRGMRFLSRKDEVGKLVTLEIEEIE